MRHNTVHNLATIKQWVQLKRSRFENHLNADLQLYGYDIEKTGEKIVYSKNLPTYFISDIMDEDVVCTIGQEDKKLLLFDDFTCWDEGCYIATVSPEVIKQLKKAN